MYYIYHIEGKKIGCTDNVEERLKAQNCTDYTVLETHTDIYIASNREIKLQKQYGYPVDKIPYYKTVKMSSKGGKIGGKIGGLIGGKIAGKIAVESGQWASIKSAGGKIGGKASGRIAVESGHLASIRSKENSSKGGKISQAQRKLCPYCNRELDNRNYGQYHGDKCKLKPLSPESSM